MKTKISIIMSSYNDGDYIQAAINSVLSQSYQFWEFIIIDDNSKDKSKSIILKCMKKEKRIKFIQNAERKGLIKNLNEGIALSKGEYIARLDSDDIWSDKNKLKIQTEFLDKNPEYGLVGTWAIVINQRSQEINRIEYPTTDLDIRNYILIENCFVHSSVIFRKNILKKIGTYDIDFENAEDYNLWLKLGSVSKFCNMPIHTIKYRINPNGITQTKYHSQIKNSIKSIQKFSGEYPHYNKAAFLWNLREYFPNSLKKRISNILKRLSDNNQYHA